MIAHFYDSYQTHSHEFCLLLLLNTSDIIELKVVVGPSNQRIGDLVPLNQDIQPKIVTNKNKIDWFWIRHKYRVCQNYNKNLEILPWLPLLNHLNLEMLAVHQNSFF